VKCYHQCLARGSKVPIAEQIRLQVCLGDALMDLGRYAESERSLSRALTLGDRTGSCHSSTAQVLLLQEARPGEALEMVEKAMELAAGGPSGDFSYDWRYRLSNLISAGMWAQKAWALALLNREAESRDAIEIASRSVNAATAGTPNYYRTSRVVGPDFRTLLRTGVAEVQWRIGMTLLALHDRTKAATHFAIARDADPQGKYGKLSQKQLN